MHTNKGNNIRIINTTTTTTTMDIKGQGTCLYSSRELKSIDIYLYHVVHEQYRLNTTTIDTTATRNHHALIIRIVHIGQHIIHYTRHTRLK